MLNVVFGHGEAAGAPLVAHPDVAMVSLTGDVGDRQVRSPARPPTTLKRVHLELGGKAPVLVFDDADVEAAVEGVRIAGYYNAGPGLHGGGARARAARKVYDDFVVRAAAAAGGAGGRRSARREDTEMGPLISRASSASASRASSSARRRTRRPSPAARRSTGPASSTSRPSSPACEQGDEMVQREVFGPVVTVQRFADEEQAIDVGQRRRLRAGGVGLDARRRPRDARRARAALRLRLDQRPHPAGVSEMPHGGFKQSGYGKDMSACTRSRTTRSSSTSW